MTPGPEARDHLRDAARRHATRDGARRARAQQALPARRDRAPRQPEIRARHPLPHRRAVRRGGTNREAAARPRCGATSTREDDEHDRADQRATRADERPDRHERGDRAPHRARRPPPAQAREARRQWLAGARQARRHDLDPRGRRGQAAVRRQEGRPCRHARSAGLGLPADRARRGHQDRAVRRWTAARPIASPCAGARRRDTDDAEGRVVATERRRGPTPDAIRAAAAALHRHDRAGAAALLGASRSTASAPTISPATARRWSWRRARSTSTASSSWRCRTPSTRCFAAECGKGTYVRALARDLGRAARLPRPCGGAAPHPRSGRSREDRRHPGSAGGGARAERVRARRCCRSRPACRARRRRRDRGRRRPPAPRPIGAPARPRRARSRARRVYAPQGVLVARRRGRAGRVRPRRVFNLARS